MNTKYSILHISDLHKSPEMTYDNLLASLMTDNENRAMEGVPPIKLIVVSGDLVQGVKDSSGNYVEQLTKQYKEVSDFLNQLVDNLLKGDKSRIIIVPGNHDYCIPNSRNSMLKSSNDYHDDLLKFMQNLCGNLRWNWEDKSFYNIVNLNLYSDRFFAYKEFYNTFFSGIRRLENVEKDAYVVDFEDYNITFACFNSCYKLDHLNPIGNIFPSALSGIRNDLSTANKLGRLIVGVWHHHVKGLPYENNYMDSSILNTMMSNYIKVGLFGHQHKTEIINEYKDITYTNDSLWLISSGTLYGDSSVQQIGQKRQFNVIEIDMNRQNAHLTVHCREDKSNNYEIPEWGVKHIGSGSVPNFQMNIKLNTPQKETIMDEIDKKVRSTGDYYSGCLTLKKEGLRDEYFCKYFDEYLQKLSNEEIINIVGDTPISEVQYICVLNANVELKNTDAVKLLLSERFERFNSAQVEECKKSAQQKLLLWQKI
ncbi:MAG: metallophosphoesterase [Paludibacteraceae bacterium]|nr:metallophosphoesterase [Paludibacteraceae bacterium]